MSKRVLIIPDLFFANYSGAIAAQSAAKVFFELGYQVGVYTEEDSKPISFPITAFKREIFSSRANYFEKTHLNNIKNVLIEFKPNLIFSIGGLVNRPIVYFNAIEEFSIPHFFLILCQDFYCARIHAALKDGPCTKCLKGSRFNAIINNCGIKTTNNQTLFLLNGMISRERIIRHLKKLTGVLGSSDEQLGFYEIIGIKPDRIFKVPLFFDDSRISNLKIEKGDYYVVAAQNRIEKGIHLIKEIIPFFKNQKLKLVFANEKEAILAIKTYELEEYIKNETVEIIFNKSWENGLNQIYAKSKGVLILSIWHTTTEFALLEALGMSKPVICFDLGIHSEIIIDGVNGFKIRLDELKKFEYDLKQLNDNDIYEVISNGARDLYKKLISKNNINNAIKNFIN